MGKRYDPKIIPILETVGADGSFLDIIIRDDGRLMAGEVRPAARPDDE